MMSEIENESVDGGSNSVKPSLQEFNKIVNYHTLTKVGYWRVSQLLTESTYELSPFLALYLGSEVAAILDETHQKGVPYSALSAENVLITTKLGIYLLKQNKSLSGLDMEHKTVEMQKDILNFGVLLFELFLKKRVSHKNYPKISALRELDNTQKGKASLKETYKGAREEVEEAFKTLQKERPQILKLIFSCLQMNKAERPLASVALEILIFELKEFTDHKKITLNRGLTLVKGKLFNSGLKNMFVRSPSFEEFVDQKSLVSTSGQDEDTVSLSDTVIAKPVSTTKAVAKTPVKRDTKKSKLSSYKTIKDDVDASDLSDTGAISNYETSTAQRKIALKKLKTGPKESLFVSDSDSSLNNISKVSSKKKDSTRGRSQDRGFDKKSKAKKPVAYINGTKLTKEAVQTFEKGINKEERLKKNLANKHDAKSISTLFDLQQRLTKETWQKLLFWADFFLSKEPNVLELEAPITILGDIHGKYYDLRNMMKTLGVPSENNRFLFLGDMVDRGNFSCETLLYLLSLKVQYLNYVYLLRGNHETIDISAHYGFKDECLKKYGSLEGLELYNNCCKVFKVLPIAAIVKCDLGEFLCVHGGIGKNVKSVESLKKLKRNVEPPNFGQLCDILWADPVYEADPQAKNVKLRNFAKEKKERTFSVTEQLSKASEDYISNRERHVSWKFNFNAIQKFLVANNLIGLIRAHQVMFEGFKYHFQEAKAVVTQNFTDATVLAGSTDSRIANKYDADSLPPVITVFSSPNYTDHKNKAAVLRIYNTVEGDQLAKKSDILDILQFDAVKEPLSVDFGEENKQKQLDIFAACPFMPLNYEKLNDLVVELDSLGGKDILAMTGKEILNKLRKLESEDLKYESNKKAAQTDEIQDVWNSFSAQAQLKNTEALQQFEEAEAQESFSEIHPNKQEAIVKDAAEGLTKVSEMISGKLGVRNVSYSERLDALDKAMLRNTLNQVGVSFEKKELLGLQMLFLLIAQTNSKQFDADDLALWCGGENAFRYFQEAANVMTKIDFDNDGLVGLEDYLTFAAMAKKLWIVHTYQKMI